MQEIVSKSEFHLARVNAVMSLIKSEMKAKGSLRVLDVGCGDGTISCLIQKLGNEVYGIDIVSELVKKAKAKGIKAKVADCERKWPFPNNFFDLVHVGQLLEHLYDTTFFLRESRRVLKKEGVLIISVPNIACLPNRIRLLFGFYPKWVAPALEHWHPGTHIRAYTKKVLVELLIKNGFRVEKVTSSLISFLPTRRTSKPWSKFLAKIFPSLGEQLIIVARKKRI